MFSSSLDPVMTSSPTTATVTPQTTPAGPSGSRRQGPVSAITASTAAQAAVSRYSTTAGCGSIHQGTKLARNVPTGTQAAATPVTRKAARRRVAFRGPRHSSAMSPNTTASATAKMAKNQPNVVR